MTDTDDLARAREVLDGMSRERWFVGGNATVWADKALRPSSRVCRTEFPNPHGEPDAAGIAFSVNLARFAFSEEGVEAMARAQWEARGNPPPGFGKDATHFPWEVCCQIVGWRDERLREMRAALSALASAGLSTGEGA